MVLSPAEKSAWAGVLAARRGGKLLPVAVQTALVDFFAANDLGISEHWPVDVKDVDWQQVWLEFADGAGLTAKFQLGAITRWIEDKAGSAAPTHHRAAAVIKLIEDGGVTLPSSMVAQIEAAISSGAAGDRLAQATCFEFVSLVYCGQLLGDSEEFKAWWTEQKAAAQTGAPIRIRSYSGYSKLHQKTTVPTLERALLDLSGKKLELYMLHLGDLLASHDLPLAAQAVEDVVKWASKQFAKMSEKMYYLQYYFFVDYEGRGCPEKFSLNGKFYIERGDFSNAILVPTSPEEAAAYARAQMAAASPWGDQMILPSQQVGLESHAQMQSQLVAETVVAVLGRLGVQAPAAGGS